MSIERLEFEVTEHGKQIRELYDKFTVLASLPDKVDTQTEILRNIAKDLAILPEHKAQLAVICEIISDYKEHKKGCIAKVVYPKQLQEDHDKITKMDAEWHLVKYVAPAIATGLGALLGKGIDKLWP